MKENEAIKELETSINLAKRCTQNYERKREIQGYEMAIKPILFNTEMVRAILDGRKTCTRRICKDANEYTVPDMDFYNADKRTYAVHNFADREHTEQLSTAERTCPICPGDILYVRETWERFECWNCEGDERGNCPKEPQKSVLDKTCGCYMYRATDEISGDAKWHSSIHMPKEAARIWLKVTGVRVERLQEITEYGCITEGIYPSNCRGCNAAFGCDTCPDEGYDEVIEFERCEKLEGV